MPIAFTYHPWSLLLLVPHDNNSSAACRLGTIRFNIFSEINEVAGAGWRGSNNSLKTPSTSILSTHHAFQALRAVLERSVALEACPGLVWGLAGDKRGWIALAIRPLALAHTLRMTENN